MIRRTIKVILKYTRYIGIAFMLAWANVFKGESKTIDDTTYRIEHVEDLKDDGTNPEN